MRAGRVYHPRYEHRVIGACCPDRIDRHVQPSATDHRCPIIITHSEAKHKTSQFFVFRVSPPEKSCKCQRLPGGWQCCPHDRPVKRSQCNKEERQRHSYSQRTVRDMSLCALPHAPIAPMRQPTKNMQPKPPKQQMFCLSKFELYFIESSMVRLMESVLYVRALYIPPAQWHE